MKKAKNFLIKITSLAVTTTILFQTLAISTAAQNIQNETATGTTYYIDSDSGSDTNNGTSKSSPWKSLEKVNSIVFQPGDQILFKTGSRYEGQLAPQGSGEEGAPIIIDMYGEGKEKPVIDGMGREGNRTVLDNEGAAVVLQNQDYWEINNLEVTNQAEKMGERFGILVRWHNYGTGEHVYIKDCYVHHISGMYQDGTIEYEENGNGSIVNKNRFQGDGIMVVATGTPESEGGIPTNFNDILIQGNYLEEIYRTGITIWSQWTDRAGGPTFYNYPSKDQVTFHTTVGVYRANTNVVIRENTMNVIAGDGILIQTCQDALIEYNKVGNCNYYSKNDANAGVWPQNSDGTLIQYNEVYETRTTADGQSFDVDLFCHNTVFQYNYSHDNEGGFLLIMNDANNTIVRYNISENDGCGVFDWRGMNVQAYNNTFYMIAPLHRNGGGSGRLYNNIFYASESMNSQDWKTIAYSNNCYYNFKNIPEDPNAITIDPKFVAAGKGAEKYQLQSDSLCVNSGLVVEDNGKLDFFGNELDDVPDIGAFDTQTDGDPTYDVSLDINYALYCPVEVSSSMDAWGWNRAYLTDGNRKAGWTTNPCYNLNEYHYIEIDLGKTVPINKLVLNNLGAFPVDFTIYIFEDETHTWKKVISKTDYQANSVESGLPEIFGISETIYGSKIRLNITELFQKSDGIYAQIGEFEVYNVDKESLGNILEQIKHNSELVAALGDILDTAITVYEKPIEDVTNTELMQQQIILEKMISTFNQSRPRFELMTKIHQMEQRLNQENSAWQYSKDKFLQIINTAKQIADDSSSSESLISDITTKLDNAFDEFMTSIDSKKKLEQSVIEASQLNLELYVEDGQDKFIEALSAAQIILENGGEVNTVYDCLNALLEAMDALRMKADKSALKVLMDKMSKVDLSIYTVESVQIFKAVLTQAQMVMDDFTLSEDDQKVVDEAAADLEKAYQGLEKKTSTGDEDSSEGDQSNPDEEGDGSGENQSDSQDNSNQEQGETNNMNTGDSTWDWALAVFLVFSACAGLFFRKRITI